MTQITRRSLIQGTLATAALASAATLAGPRAQAHPRDPSSGVHRFYVALDGDDTWTGDEPTSQPSEGIGPFRTLHRARDAVRALRASDGVTGPVEVVVAPGTYYLAEPLAFTPEDSGTEAFPTRWIADGDVVLSGGRLIEGAWTTSGGIASTTVPDPWPFRSLFVDGRRQTLARFPNVDTEHSGRSYLYNGGQQANVIMSGIANAGDFVEHRFTVETADSYDLWLGVATVETGLEHYVEISIDDDPLTLGPIEGSGGYRATRYSRAATSVMLSAGEHVLRIASIAAPERRVHLDAAAFTTEPGFTPSGPDLPPPAPGERRAVVQLDRQSSIIASFSSIGFDRFPVSAVPTGTTRLKADPELVKAGWVTDPQARVEVVPELHYLSTSCRLVAVEESTGIVEIEQMSQPLALLPSNHFFVAGVRDELDQPGEWYHNPDSGLLELMPEDGVDPNEVEVVAPVLEHVVVYQGDAVGGGRVEWIELRGFTVKHSTALGTYASVRSPTDAAIKLDCARHCTIEDCTIESVDGYGIWLHLDSSENVVSHNEIRDIGIGGVLLTAATLDYGIAYDDRPQVQELAALGNVFSFNHIHHGGRVRLQAAGFNLGSRPASTALDAGNAFIGNHIHDMTRQGLFGFRNQGGNIVAYNLIHDVVLETADAGAINFAIMTNIAAPNLVRNNTIRHSNGLFRFNEEDSKDYGFGLYADHGASHNAWVQNTVSDTQYPAFLHGGQFSTLIDNVLADPGQLWAQDTDRIMLRNRARRNVIANELRVVDRPLNISNPPPEMAGEIAAAPWLAYDINRNLLQHPDSDPLAVPSGRLSDWQAAGNDTFSLRGDPLFHDPATGNYGLTASSPAYQLPIASFDPANSGIDAEFDDDFDLTSMAAPHATAERSLSPDERTATYDLAVPEPGLYRLYGRRSAPGTAPLHVLVTVEHDHGVTRHAFDELAGRGRNPVERFGFYLGTFDLASTGRVTFFQPADAEMWTPEDVVAVRVPQLDLDAHDEPWELMLAASSAKLEAGSQTPAVVAVVSAEGQITSEEVGPTRIESDNPAAVTVTAGGMIQALAPGLARLRAISEGTSDVIRSDELLITVGDVLWAAQLTIDDELIGVGDSTAVTVSATLDTGVSVTPSPGEITYESLAPAIATVDSGGLVTGVSDGTAVIAARVTRDGVEVSASVEARVAASVAPLLRYAFDETGPAVDAADLGTAPLAAGTFRGSAVRSGETPLLEGSSLDLTAAGTGYVTPGPDGSAKLDDLARFSISCWVRLAEDPDVYDRIFGRGEAFEWVVNSGGRDAAATYLRLGGVYHTLPPIDLSEWTFVAFVGTGARLAVYVGAEDSPVSEVASLSSTRGLAAAPGVELRIGGTTLTTADRTPPALLDEFRIYPLDLPQSVLDDVRNQGRTGTTEEPPVADPWDSGQAYTAGDEVTFAGALFAATWWTQNQEPGDPTGPWQELAVTPEGDVLWTASRIFDNGDEVRHEGARYRAKWWTRNQEPGDPTGPWTALG